MLIFWGIFTLVATIFTVMGVPFVYFLKRDNRWEQGERTVEGWHNRI